ncbi:MAG TPA: nucleotidyltransferase domain-containing protein [Candidatus Nanoarchaeia archaeon]|nr:nucleotidyltransferase domain-containing protein [Candidatus Nanoarchaeia archaeon]
MEIKMNILEPLFLNPQTGFLMREIAKTTKINHSTIRKYLNYYVREHILIQKNGKPYPLFTVNMESKKYLNLKLYFNLEQLRKSNIIEHLEKFFEYPPIVLFGSFSKGTDDEQSDIDICVITDIQREFNTKVYEKTLRRPVSIHQYSEKNWNRAKDKNKGLVNNIANGITLAGQLEVL